MFPHEVMPMDAKQISKFLKDGFHLTSDGRYIPPKELVEELYNTYGSKVGLLSDWEKHYDSIIAQ